jgi:hypothetical protein
MRYPPALSYTPQRSQVYASAAVLVTIVLIALCAYSIPASGHFSFKNGLFMGLAVAASLWLLFDAYRKPRGQLHYAQGVWTWQLESQEIPGTLHLHVDLQTYMLVSFAALHENKSLLPKKKQWFHLEAGHFKSAGGSSDWAALRRAVHVSVSVRAEPAHEAVAT